jgi:predicted Rossmann-fold nucleotide-binding protein
VKRIAVFCGSSNGASHLYVEGAKQLGKELAKRNLTLAMAEPALA